MERNIFLLILLMPFLAFTQNDLNLKKSPEIEVENNLILESRSNLEKQIKTALINDSNYSKSDKDIDLSKSYALALNIDTTTDGRLLNIMVVQKMNEMLLNLHLGDYKRQFGKEINFKNSLEN